MGYWNIKCDKCGKYLWDENTDLVREMETEWDSGYKAGVQDRETVERMQEKIAALEALLGANVRVIKEEIKKELESDKGKT